MRVNVDTLRVWEDGEGRWRWTAYVGGDQPYNTPEQVYPSKDAAKAAAQGAYPDAAVKAALKADPREFRFPGEDE